MDTDLLKEKFEKMGARAKVHLDDGRELAIDIRRDRKGEYFELRVNPRPGFRLDAIDVRPRDRHLLLMARDQGGPARRFLCGHDERDWFVAAIPEGRGASNVFEAMDALKPHEVRQSIARAGVRFEKRHRRRTAAFVRQGEWFFIPMPDLRVPEANVLRNEPIRRGRGKPHWVEFLSRSGGEAVYVSRLHPNGLTAAEHVDWIRRNPDSKVRFTLMQRDAFVYAKGRVSHPDHKTIVLRCWHRVVMNTEHQAAAMRNVAFLD